MIIQAPPVFVDIRTINPLSISNCCNYPKIIMVSNPKARFFVQVTMLTLTINGSEGGI